MQQYRPASRRRRWPWILIVLVVLGAGLWAAGWHYAAGKVESTIAGWKEREARSGRVYSCANESISGFPFRIEVRCGGAGAQLRTSQQPIAVAAKELTVTAEVWQPTVLNSEIMAPMTIGEPAQPATVTGNWRRARTQVRGLPTSPENVHILLDEPVFERASGGGRETFKARRAEVNGRMLEGTARANPVIELTLKLIQATAPSLHSAAERPTDADVTAVLRGLKDFSPKPWPARFREMQAAGGRIEVTKARIQQGETIMAADGVLGLSSNGRLDGELRVTVANLQQLLPALGLDKLTAPEARPNRLGSALSALDRVSPGLGNVARQNAGPALAAGIILMGKQTELEGQRAVALPLRFNDGAVSLGPLPLGQTPPLY
jgi:hypothetical protein